MSILFRLVYWDLKLQARNGIITVAIIIAVIYTGLFLLFGLKNNDKILVAILFSDPTFLGYIFTGVLVLFEKNANTLQALVVTPVKIWQYLFSKAISLTFIALIICFAMVFASHGFQFNYLLFIAATFLSSVLFIFLGFLGVAKVKTFNQYILVIPFFFLPLILPFLNFFEITHSYWLYLIPTQASFILFQAAFEKIKTIEIVYAFIYLLLFIGITYYFSKRLFLKHIIKGE